VVSHDDHSKHSRAGIQDDEDIVGMATATSAPDKGRLKDLADDNNHKFEVWSKPAIFYFIYATILTLMPSLPFAALAGKDAAFLFLTGDAYLYLGIAQHSTADFYSYDGIAPTNGFHPLWQAYIWLAAQLTGNDDYILMNITAWSCIVFNWIGVILLGVAIAKGTRSWLLAGLVVPGVYYFLFGAALGSNLSVWEFNNGMENGLAFALTAAISLMIVQAKHDENRLGFWLGLSFLAGLLMLCRLDEVFVPATIGLAWLLWNPEKLKSRLLAVVVLGSFPTLMLAGYFYYNLSYMDVLMPISGAAKGEGALIQNGWVTLANLLAPVTDVRSYLTDYQPDYPSLGGADFRVVELIAPAVLALAFIPILYTHFRQANWAPFVAGMCAAIIIKATYNFVFVGYWHQAPWYFAFAQGTISLTTALLISRLVNGWRVSSPRIVAFLATVIAVFSFQKASKTYFVTAAELETGERQAFFAAGPQIDRKLQAKVPNGRIIEFGDGMLNFTLDRSVRHGFVFAGDKGSLEALQQGHLLRSAYEDGYSILSSYEYYRWRPVDPEMTSDEIRDRLALIGANKAIVDELDGYEFRIVHYYEPLGIPFISFEPK
jgi:hypothetical protein